LRSALTYHFTFDSLGRINKYIMKYTIYVVLIQQTANFAYFIIDKVKLQG